TVYGGSQRVMQGEVGREVGPAGAGRRLRAGESAHGGGLSGRGHGGAKPRWGEHVRDEPVRGAATERRQGRGGRRGGSRSAGQNQGRARKCEPKRAQKRA